MFFIPKIDDDLITVLWDVLIDLLGIRRHKLKRRPTKNCGKPLVLGVEYFPVLGKGALKRKWMRHSLYIFSSGQCHLAIGAHMERVPLFLQEDEVGLECEILDLGNEILGIGRLGSGRRRVRFHVSGS